MEMTFLYILMFFMIVGALIALETKNLLSSIISVGAVGFLLSIVFLLLGAPDIAITQVVMEILCLIILIRATYHRDLTVVGDDREFVGLIAAISLLAVVVVISLKVFYEFPPFGTSVLDRIPGAPSHTYLAQSLQKTGASNIVTAIILDFRAFDTLAVIAVFFSAMVGALAVLRKRTRMAELRRTTEGK